MSVADNLKTIRKTIVSACKDAGRAPESVTLVAVSKKQSAENISQALAAGQRVFGENRVQEAQEHWQTLKSQYPDLKLHLIGPLQSNKAGDAVALFDVIETVDRKKIARVLAEEMNQQNRHLPCFIQVNTGNEPQKAGVPPADLEELLVYGKAQGLNITGLMCIPPFDEPAALHFAFLKKLAERYGLAQLSMGMSADFEKAIALGASFVRIGTGVFGKR